MADELGFTEADRKRAAALAARNGVFPAQLCADLRRRAKRTDETPRKIAQDPEITWAEKTVGDHLAGRCTHDVEEPPLESVGTANTGPTLTAEECAEIRRLDDAGYTQTEIAARVDRSDSSVYRHASGSCRHGPAEDDEPEIVTDGGWSDGGGWERPHRIDDESDELSFGDDLETGLSTGMGEDE